MIRPAPRLSCTYRKRSGHFRGQFPHVTQPSCCRAASVARACGFWLIHRTFRRYINGLIHKKIATHPNFFLPERPPMRTLKSPPREFASDSGNAKAPDGNGHHGTGRKPRSRADVTDRTDAAGSDGASRMELRSLRVEAGLDRSFDRERFSGGPQGNSRRRVATQAVSGSGPSWPGSLGQSAPWGE